MQDILHHIAETLLPGQVAWLTDFQEGKIVECNTLINQTDYAIYSQIHSARPDVVVAAHAHSIIA